MPPKLILRDFKTIKVMDAVLAWDAKEFVRDVRGKPLGCTDAEGNRVDVWRYKNPKQPEWPEADFIVASSCIPLARKKRRHSLGMRD